MRDIWSKFIRYVNEEVEATLVDQELPEFFPAINIRTRRWKLWLYYDPIFWFFSVVFFFAASVYAVVISTEYQMIGWLGTIVVCARLLSFPFWMWRLQKAADSGKIAGIRRPQ